jgi:hypothetical protein
LNIVVEFYEPTFIFFPQQVGHVQYMTYTQYHMYTFIIIIFRVSSSFFFFQHHFAGGLENFGNELKPKKIIKKWLN